MHAADISKLAARWEDLNICRSLCKPLETLQHTPDYILPSGHLSKASKGSQTSLYNFTANNKISSSLMGPYPSCNGPRKLHLTFLRAPTPPSSAANYLIYASKSTCYLCDLFFYTYGAFKVPRTCVTICVKKNVAYDSVNSAFADSYIPSNATARLSVRGRCDVFYTQDEDKINPKMLSIGPRNFLALENTTCTGLFSMTRTYDHPPSVPFRNHLDPLQTNFVLASCMFG